MKKLVSLFLAITLLFGVFYFGANAGEEEPVTIVYYNCSYNDAQTEDIEGGTAPLNELLAQYGMRLDMHLLNSSEYLEKMNLMINSNEYFDICFVAQWSLDLNANVAKGAFLDITDLMEENMPGTLATFDPAYLDFGKINGRQYGILNLQILANPIGLRVRKEYADKYGFSEENLKSLDDIYKFFDCILENEPDIYPVASGLVHWHLGHNTTNINNYCWIEEGDDSLTVIPFYETIGKQDEYKTNRYMYEQGYIRPDYASITDNTAEIMAGMYASDFGDVKPGCEAELATRWGVDVLCIKMADNMMAYNSGCDTMHAISINSEHPEKAMQYLDLVNTNTEVVDALLFGQEGIHHIIDEDGKIAMAENSRYFLGSTSWAYCNVFKASIMEGQDWDIWEKTEAINDAAFKSPITGFSLNSEPFQNELAQVSAVTNEYNNWVYQPNYEQLYEQMVDKLKAAGIETMCAEIQQQIDAWAVATGKK